MAIDHHKEAYDEGTKVKLLLFEEYLNEWLPVFIKGRKQYVNNMNIFDFFCGPGHDINGVKGSPLITINSLDNYNSDIQAKNLTVNLFFNDETKRKIIQLKNTLAKLDTSKNPCNIYTTSDDFKDAFEMNYNKMLCSSTANFLFLDQNGVKHITESIFKRIIDLPFTDFIFFISSSTFKRFGSHPDILKYHQGIAAEKFYSSNFHDIHRNVADYYRGMIPNGKEYYIVPFSIKKSSNIYGLIFGSGNLLGVEKFLTRCWKIDPQRGEANFDIDGDKIDPQRPFLFEDMNAPKKLQVFEVDLTEKIISKSINTNIEIYHHTIKNGFLPKHSRTVLKNMKKGNLIPHQSLPISYDSCIKKKQTREIILFGAANPLRPKKKSAISS